MSPTPPTPDPSSNPPQGKAFRHAAIDPSTLEMALLTLQQRLDGLQQSLNQQNKLATLGMVTAVIAHEFNNILTPMIAYTSFALGEKADDALRTKGLQKALAGAERLANISQSLLGFTRGDESVSAQVSVAVRDTLACLARDPAKDGITLVVEIPDELHVAMNGGQLQQVLMNLIVNARSAMLAAPGSGPGTTALSTPTAAGKRHEVQAIRKGPGGVKRLTIKALQTMGQQGDKRVEIHVVDTGPGIPAEVLPRIFEPFFSTKKRGEVKAEVEGAEGEAMPKGGTGLGLTICRELVVAAGGEIRAQSEVGKGATFVLELPVGALEKA